MPLEFNELPTYLNFPLKLFNETFTTFIETFENIGYKNSNNMVLRTEVSECQL